VDAVAGTTAPSSYGASSSARPLGSIDRRGWGQLVAEIGEHFERY
jgi:hypothetical protein